MTPEMWEKVKADFQTKWPPSVLIRLNKEVKFRTWERGLRKLPKVVADLKIKTYQRTGKMT